MNELGKERLLKLAAYLESGKLAHEKFNLGCFNSPNLNDMTDDVPEGVCHTYGCALGEMPRVDSEHWHWTRATKSRGEPILSCNGLNPLPGAMAYFDLPAYVCFALFYPVKFDDSFRHDLGFKPYDVSTDPILVAQNIRTIVSKYD